ncbi:MAG: ABC transporter permease [Planctomycetes bacterium]|nr:ABC transporter permease [Planctomycetota bacterium]
MSRGPLPLFKSLVLVASFAAHEVSWSRKTVFLGLLLLVPAGIATIIRSEAPPGEVGEFLEFGMTSLVIGIVQLMCLFHGAGLIRDAMEERTLAFLLTRPIGRSRVAFGMYLGLLMYVLPIGLISATAGFAACRAGLPGGMFSDVAMSPASAEALMRLLQVTGAAVVFYGALYTLFGLVFKASTIVGLLFLMIFDGLLGSLPGPPRMLSPMGYFETLASPYYQSRATMYSEMEAHTIESSTAVIVLVAALLVIMLVTRRIARGKDFVAFQKAQ